MKVSIKHAFGLAIASLGLGALLAAPGALAQGQGQGQQQYQPPAAQGQVSDAQLQSFVEAQTKVNEIQVKYSEKIQSTQDPEKAQTLQSEAQDKMIKAVDEAGLDVQEYNQIAQQMSRDPEMRARIQELMGS